MWGRPNATQVYLAGWRNVQVWRQDSCKHPFWSLIQHSFDEQSVVVEHALDSQ